jgi:hypothetical protein
VIIMGEGTWIDRMTIEIPGVSAAMARHIALMVAASLGETGALPAAGDLVSVQVEIAASAGAPPSELVRRIVAATLRQVRRTV